jgi:hypothetical protein
LVRLHSYHRQTSVIQHAEFRMDATSIQELMGGTMQLSFSAEQALLMICQRVQPDRLSPARAAIEQIGQA